MMSDNEMNKIAEELESAGKNVKELADVFGNKNHAEAEPKKTVAKDVKQSPFMKQVDEAEKMETERALTEAEKEARRIKKEKKRIAEEHRAIASMQLDINRIRSGIEVTNVLLLSMILNDKHFTAVDMGKLQYSIEEFTMASLEIDDKSGNYVIEYYDDDDDE